MTQRVQEWYILNDTACPGVVYFRHKSHFSETFWHTESPIGSEHSDQFFPLARCPGLLIKTVCNPCSQATGRVVLLQTLLGECRKFGHSIC
jgi:hypothetical protein